MKNENKTKLFKILSGAIKKNDLLKPKDGHKLSFKSFGVGKYRSNRPGEEKKTYTTNDMYKSYMDHKNKNGLFAFVALWHSSNGDGVELTADQKQNMELKSVSLVLDGAQTIKGSKSNTSARVANN